MTSVFFYKIGVKIKKTSPWGGLLEATIRLELMNKAFAEPPLTNLGTSPFVEHNIGNDGRFAKGKVAKKLNLGHVWLI